MCTNLYHHYDLPCSKISFPHNSKAISRIYLHPISDISYSLLLYYLYACIALFSSLGDRVIQNRASLIAFPNKKINPYPAFSSVLLILFLISRDKRKSFNQQHKGTFLAHHHLNTRMSNSRLENTFCRRKYTGYTPQATLCARHSGTFWPVFRRFSLSLYRLRLFRKIRQNDVFYCIWHTGAIK